MASLVVTVNVNGALATGALTVSVWPATTFGLQPQRGHAAPNAAATATGTLSGGSVTLTGLSSVNYQLLVVDARGVNNWWFVPAAYTGGSYTATIPWSTPTTVSKAVSIGGDTPGGPLVMAPWAQRLHFHEVPTTGVLTITKVSAPHTYKAVGVASNGNWIAVGSSGIDVSSNQGSTWTNFTSSGFVGNSMNISGNNVLVVGSATSITVAFRYSTDGGATWSAVGTVTGPATAPVYPHACLWLGSTWWVSSNESTTALYKSTNNGTSWTTVALPSPNPTNHSTEPGALMTDGASLIVAVGLDAQIGSGVTFVFSTDAGVTWTAPAGAQVTPNLTAALLDSGDFVSMLSGTSNPPQEINLTTPNSATSPNLLATFPMGTAQSMVTLGGGISAQMAVGGQASTGQTSIWWTLDGGVQWKTTTSGILTTQCTDLAWVDSKTLLCIGTGAGTPMVLISNIS